MTGANAKIKRIMIGDKQVRPVWKPGANTLLYMPLNGDAKDEISGNVGTRGGTARYTTLSSGLKVAYCASISDYITGPTITIGTNRTFNVWLKRESGNLFVRFDRTSDRLIYYVQSTGSYVGGGKYPGISSSTAYPATNDWVNVVATYSSSGFKVYVNGQIIYTNSYNTFPNVSLPLDINRDRISPYNQSGAGYVSNVIVEDKVRTDAEVADYYNQTKSKYGL